MTRLLNGVGLGTFPFANPFTEVPEQTALEIIDEHLQLGGSYFDTSPTYAFGAVEELLGKALRRHDRDKFFISTSCGYVREGDAYRVSGRYDDVIRDCEESLARLGLEFVDIYMSHIPDPETPFAETVAALADLRQAGKARFLAVSNVTLGQLREYNEDGEINFVQNRLSLLNRGIEPEFTEYCEANQIGIVAYQVIERGALTAIAASGLPPDLGSADLRRRKPEFADEVQARLRGWVHRELEPIASNVGVTVTALAVAWTLQQPAISLAQMGATSVSQVRDNASAATVELDQDVLRAIEESYARLEHEIRETDGTSVRGFMGLEDYNVYGGSASGR